MKKFLYGRLHDKIKGNDFYILPELSVGSLHKAIASDMVGDDVKLLFLQNHNGVISFGVREQITLRDAFGRLRCNFTGYQLEKGETPEKVPYFDALQEKFSEITDEAYECHRQLDADPECGKSMKAMTFSFGTGTFQRGNKWDEVVRELRSNPSANILFVFDQHGNTFNMPGTSHAIMDSNTDANQRPQTVRTAPPARQTEAGIVSSVSLNDNEKTVLPPLPDPEIRQEEGSRGFLRINWRLCNPRNWGISKAQELPSKGDDPQPEP